jgi:hypothetical protein
MEMIRTYIKENLDIVRLPAALLAALLAAVVVVLGRTGLVGPLLDLSPILRGRPHQLVSRITCSKGVIESSLIPSDGV